MAGRGSVWAELPWGDVKARLEQLAREAGGCACSGFLDTHQWSPGLGDAKFQLHGGHAHAQFRRAGLGAMPPVRCFQLERSALPEGVRTARQLRAWLYRNGLPDGAVGDIVLGDPGCLAVEEDVELAEFGLSAKLLPGWQAPEGAALRVTAAGPRADSVVAALFKVSRGEAQTAIRYGFVFLNFKPVEKQTQPCPAGSQLVYRTKGRAELLALDAGTKSGRIWVEHRLYPS